MTAELGSDKENKVWRTVYLLKLPRLAKSCA
jgi:hypothetical protein